MALYFPCKALIGVPEEYQTFLMINLSHAPYSFSRIAGICNTMLPVYLIYYAADDTLPLRKHND
jgi:hypothetical protein